MSVPRPPGRRLLPPCSLGTPSLSSRRLGVVKPACASDPSRLPPTPLRTWGSAGRLWQPAPRTPTGLDLSPWHRGGGQWGCALTDPPTQERVPPAPWIQVQAGLRAPGAGGDILRCGCLGTSCPTGACHQARWPLGPAPVAHGSHSPCSSCRSESQHRFWKPRELDVEPDGADAPEVPPSRHITFAGTFEPVQHRCRAPRPDGRLCERQDRQKVRRWPGRLPLRVPRPCIVLLCGGPGGGGGALGNQVPGSRHPTGLAMPQAPSEPRPAETHSVLCRSARSTGR